MQPYEISEKNSDFCCAVHGEGWRVGLPSSPCPSAAWRRQRDGGADGSAQLSHAPCRPVWTGGPGGTQEQLPDGSQRRRLLNGHRPVGRLVWQNAAICLPAPTNPLRSPYTHIQTLFPGKPQGRKASAFELGLLMKPGLSGVLL